MGRWRCDGVRGPVSEGALLLQRGGGGEGEGCGGRGEVTKIKRPGRTLRTLKDS